jgi:hypothetical protein
MASARPVGVASNRPGWSSRAGKAARQAAKRVSFGPLPTVIVPIRLARSGTQIWVVQASHCALALTSAAPTRASAGSVTGTSTA